MHTRTPNRHIPLCPTKGVFFPRGERILNLVFLHYFELSPPSPECRDQSYVKESIGSRIHLMIFSFVPFVSHLPIAFVACEVWERGWKICLSIILVRICCTGLSSLLRLVRVRVCELGTVGEHHLLDGMVILASVASFVEFVKRTELLLENSQVQIFVAPFMWKYRVSNHRSCR
jgi:hypothetical protein